MSTSITGVKLVTSVDTSSNTHTHSIGHFDTTDIERRVEAETEASDVITSVAKEVTNIPIYKDLGAGAYL